MVGGGGASGLVANVHEDGATVLRLDGAGPGAARELRLQAGHELGDVDVSLCDGDGADSAVRRGALVGGVGGDVVGPGNGAGLAGGGELDGGDEVEAQPDEVDQVVAGQRLAVQVGVDEAQAAEAAFGGAQAADVREHELRGVAHDDGVDLAGPVDEDADLASRLERHGGESSRELGGREIVGGDAAAVEALERLVSADGESPVLFP